MSKSPGLKDKGDEISVLGYRRAATFLGFTQTMKTLGLYLEYQGQLSLYKVCMLTYTQAYGIKVQESVNRR